MLVISAGNSTTMWASIKPYNNSTPATPVPRSSSRRALVSPLAACPMASRSGCTTRHSAASSATPTAAPTTCTQRRGSTLSPLSPHAEQVHDEDQRLIGADDAAGAALAVGEVGRDRDPAPAAHAHAGDALVPAGDDLALAEPELEGVAAVPRGVELAAALPRDADIMHFDDLARDRLVAVADLEVLELELVGRRAVGDRDVGLLGGGHAGTVPRGDQPPASLTS